MTDPTAARKDVADLLETLARKIRNDPEWGAGQPSRDESGITVYNGDEGPVIGAVDLYEDVDSITVTAETKNADANAVHVTLADDRLYIALGEGPRSARKDVRLPQPVDEEKAVATFRNGILDVVLPRRRRG
jgi:HSP20 family protein